jgi:hypothetical protein
MNRSPLLTAALCLLPALSAACIHAYAPQPVAVGQTKQTALLIHQDGVEDLIINVGYRAEAPVERLAWVLPVPNVPTRYRTADSALFDELYSWVELQRKPPLPRGLRTLSTSSAQAVGLTVLDSVRTGPYQIQPLQATGDAGIAALTTWMTSNGFTPIPREQLSYYVERRWTFLAVRIDSVSEKLDAEGGLPPLHVRFASEQAVYPLKLSTHMGEFPVRLYLVTKESLAPSDFETARAWGFHVAGARAGNLALSPSISTRYRSSDYRVAVSQFQDKDAPAALQEILKAIDPSSAQTWHLRVLFAADFRANRENNNGLPVSSGEDLSVPGVGTGQLLGGVR